MKKLLFLSLAAMLSLGALSACSDDTENPQDINCADDELYNPRTKECVNINGTTDTDVTDTTDSADDTTDSTDALIPTDDTQVPTEDSDTDDQTDAVDPIDPECDKDNDGHLAYECGGYDCDDNDPARFPDQFEICNGIDDNCNTLVDELLECTFFAHTSDALYKVNPFDGTLDKESDLIDSKGVEITLLDIDTHPSGTLYGIGYLKKASSVGLYIFDTTENFWVRAATINVAKHANGLAIDFEGVAFITIDSKVFKLDLTRTEELLEQKGLKDSSFPTTPINLQAIDITPNYFISSGDSVVNKQNTLFMTSKHETTEDHLVEINRDTAATVSIGPVGFDKVFGLTAAWNNLYGTTLEGELITIDVKTGKGKLVKNFAGKRWYGAASSPNR